MGPRLMSRGKTAYTTPIVTRRPQCICEGSCQLERQTESDARPSYHNTAELKGLAYCERRPGYAAHLASRSDILARNCQRPNTP